MREPRWDAPDRIGYAGAIDSMGSVAAPLFAGFAVVVTVQILTSPEITRWPDLALVLTLLAAAALGASVQFAFRARLFAATPPEIEAWWPEPDEATQEMMRAQQRRHQAAFRVWADRARHAYNVGLLAFLAAIVVVLVPPGDWTTMRALAAILAAVALTVELAWVLRT